ncbi:hypothetical protein LINPERHAP1_LOCUS13000 [Linum perenne]
MKRNFPKYVAPGDLRKDSKRSTSFRALCSTSNPATKQDNATGVVETTTTSWKQPSVTKNAAEKTTTTSWKQPSFMKNVEDIPTTRKGTTITTHKTRQQPFDIEDEDASDSDVPQSPMQTVMEEDHPETNIQSSIQPNMEEDHPETNMEDIYDDPLPQEANRKRKGRGLNMCRDLAKLNKDEKLPIEFVDGRGAGPNGATFTSHLGVILRDPNIMPIRILKWKCLSEFQLDHLWAAAQEYFESEDMPHHKEGVLDHMREMWNRWRSQLKGVYLYKILNVEQALKKTPPRMDKEDWAWLVRNVYFTKEYKKKSDTNKRNRRKKKLIHHIGSKPTRQIKYEYRKEHCVFPPLRELFEAKFNEGGVVKHPEAIKKLDEINKAYESNPDATEFDVVEKVFGPQNHGKAAIFGGGVKVKDIRGTSSSKYSELNAKLQQSEAEKVALQNRLEDADLANERREKEINDLKAADDKRDKEMQELKSMVLSLVARMPQP